MPMPSYGFRHRSILQSVYAEMLVISACKPFALSRLSMPMTRKYCRHWCWSVTARRCLRQKSCYGAMMAYVSTSHHYYAYCMPRPVLRCVIHSVARVPNGSKRHKKAANRCKPANNSNNRLPLRRLQHCLICPQHHALLPLLIMRIWVVSKRLQPWSMAAGRGLKRISTGAINLTTPNPNTVRSVMATIMPRWNRCFRVSSKPSTVTIFLRRICC